MHCVLAVPVRDAQASHWEAGPDIPVGITSLPISANVTPAGIAIMLASLTHTPQS